MQKLQVKFDDTIGDTPAALSAAEATIYINKPVFSKFTRFQKKFIILHEMGHYYLNTHNELLADAYALRALAGSEYQSLKQSIETLDVTLHDGNVTKAERMRNLVLLALYWDWQHGNEAAKTELVRRMEMDNSSGSIGLFGWDFISWNTTNEKDLAEADRIVAQTEETRANTELTVSIYEQRQQQEAIGTYVEYGLMALVVAGIIYFLVND